MGAKSVAKVNHDASRFLRGLNEEAGTKVAKSVLLRQVWIERISVKPVRQGQLIKLNATTSHR